MSDPDSNVPTETATTATAPAVDPRAPRFGQGLTASLLAVAIVLGAPWLVALVALSLTLAVASRWRLDPYALLWRHVLIPLVGPPSRTETAAPHRFAKLIGATFTLAATPLVLVGGPVALAGYALAGVVAVLAGLAATTGFCLGCRLYGQLASLGDWIWSDSRQSSAIITCRCHN